MASSEISELSMLCVANDKFELLAVGAFIIFFLFYVIFVGLECACIGVTIVASHMWHQRYDFLSHTHFSHSHVMTYWCFVVVVVVVWHIYLCGMCAWFRAIVSVFVWICCRLGFWCAVYTVIQQQCMAKFAQNSAHSRHKYTFARHNFMSFRWS